MGIQEKLLLNLRNLRSLSNFRMANIRLKNVDDSQNIVSREARRDANHVHSAFNQIWKETTTAISRGEVVLRRDNNRGASGECREKESAQKLSRNRIRIALAP